jgi:hypothetical protein
MSIISRVLLVLVVVGLLGGAAFLATWEIPPPSATVKKVIPNDRFPR